MGQYQSWWGQNLRLGGHPTSCTGNLAVLKLYFFLMFCFYKKGKDFTVLRSMNIEKYWGANVGWGCKIWHWGCKCNLKTIRSVTPGHAEPRELEKRLDVALGVSFLRQTKPKRSFGRHGWDWKAVSKLLELRKKARGTHKQSEKHGRRRHKRVKLRRLKVQSVYRLLREVPERRCFQSTRKYTLN